MRRTNQQREEHARFIEDALKNAFAPMKIALLLREQFGLTWRQARYDVKQALVRAGELGMEVEKGEHQAEDLGLQARRYERIFRELVAKGDLRSALKAEKARCRLLGVYATDKPSLKEQEEDALEEQIEKGRIENFTHSRRKLRKVSVTEPTALAAGDFSVTEPTALAAGGSVEQPVAEAASFDAPNPRHAYEDVGVAPDDDGPMAPPLGRNHREGCVCWMCNPMYQAQQEAARRRQYPAWVKEFRAAHAELSPLLSKWRGRRDRETDAEFTARVKQALEGDGRVLCVDPPPHAREVEQRLSVLAKWLELGVSRDICRQRYAEKFELSPRQARREWDLCLRQFRRAGRELMRRWNKSVALGLALKRRDLLVERCMTAGDYKLALDIEIDRTRLLGLLPKQRRAAAATRPRFSDAAWLETASDLLDHFDPAGRGCGVPSDRERELVAKVA